MSLEDRTVLTRKILLKSAELVRSGWVRCFPVYVNKTGREYYCMTGAIGKAISSFEETRGLYLSEKILELVKLALPHCVCGFSVIHFNDLHCTSGEEAARIFEKAIILLDS